MSKTDSQEPDDEMKKLFESIRHHLPTVVRQACGNLKYSPEPMELDGLEQRVALSLIENDYHPLRSFAHHSEPQPWLYTIAKRKVLERLRQQKRMLSLEDVLPAAFTSQPDQEERLISEEEEKKREKLFNSSPFRNSFHARLATVSTQLRVLRNTSSTRQECNDPEESSLIGLRFAPGQHPIANGLLDQFENRDHGFARRTLKDLYKFIYRITINQVI